MVQVDALVIGGLHLVIVVGKGFLHVGCLVPVDLFSELELGLLLQSRPVACVLYLVVCIRVIVASLLREEEGASLTAVLAHRDGTRDLKAAPLQRVFHLCRADRVEVGTWLWTF